MKKMIKYQLIVLSIFMILGSQLSCKKAVQEPVDSSYEVQYKILPTSSITKITYTDATGATVVLNDASQFQNGIKTIRVSTKPFTAKISVDINNQTSFNLNGLITIFVNGEAKQSQGILVPAMSSQNGITNQYVIQ